ncbi:MAG: hypothetical protein ABW032_00925 [Burkholderiaceae bacterium]
MVKALDTVVEVEKGETDHLLKVRWGRPVHGRIQAAGAAEDPCRGC